MISNMISDLFISSRMTISHVWPFPMCGYFPCDAISHMWPFPMCDHFPCVAISHVWMATHGKWPHMGNGHTWEMATYGKWPHMGNGHTWEMATYGKWPHMGNSHTWEMATYISHVWPFLICGHFPCVAISHVRPFPMQDLPPFDMSHPYRFKFTHFKLLHFKSSLSRVVISFQIYVL
jgi:hypothetical protein